MRMESIGGKVLRLVLAVAFVAAGGMKLAAVAFEVREFAHFGYAAWFMYFMGVWELVCGLTLVRARLAAAGAALLLPVMVGAAYSHLASGDGIGMAAPAMVLLVLLDVVVWLRRGDLPRWAPRAMVATG